MWRGNGFEYVSGSLGELGRVEGRRSGSGYARAEWRSGEGLRRTGRVRAHKLIELTRAVDPAG